MSAKDSRRTLPLRGCARVGLALLLAAFAAEVGQAPFLPGAAARRGQAPDAPRGAGRRAAAPAPGGLDAYSATIHEIAGLVPATSVVLLSTPPSALSGDSRSVTAGVVDAATTQRYRDALDARMRGAAADLVTRGRRVTYVPHELSREVFLDDCH